MAASGTNSPVTPTRKKISPPNVAPAGAPNISGTSTYAYAEITENKTNTVTSAHNARDWTASRKSFFATVNQVILAPPVGHWYIGRTDPQERIRRPRSPEWKLRQRRSRATRRTSKRHRR